MSDPDWDAIPQNIQDGITSYIRDHVPTGGFLAAVMANNLKLAVGRADQHSLAALPAIVRWLSWNAPGDCWGSEEARARWVSGGAK